MLSRKFNSLSSLLLKLKLNTLNQNEELTGKVLEHLIQVFSIQAAGMDTARLLQKVGFSQDCLPFMSSFLILLFLYISCSCFGLSPGRKHTFQELHPIRKDSLHLSLWNDYTTQSNLQIQCNPYQTTNGIFCRTRTKNFTICMETQKTLNSQSNLEKEKWSWRNQAPWLQTLLQSYSNQDNMVVAQKQKYRSMEQDRKPRDKPMYIWSPYLW